MNGFIYLLYFLISVLTLNISAQGNITITKTLYSGKPNHLELIDQSLRLAIDKGFNDTADISLEEIKKRLEAGAYSEDLDIIPGMVGDHFPSPWDQGPDFDFNGLYPFTKIPYGSLIDTLSGWFRGLAHGYEPVKGFIWPGANTTTIGWANSAINYFTWDKAIALYKSGRKAEAYESLGHILHLLEDLSIPAHVKLVNHGITINKVNSGTIIDPDLLWLVVDEYELALTGGISLPNIITLIPNLLDDFRKALESAKYQEVPDFPGWQDYLINLAKYTYNDPVVNQFYKEPAKNNEWGHIKDKDGIPVEPVKYGITPVEKIGDRWVQISLKSTATIDHGSFIPESGMIAMCNNLVPKAAEYSAGLIMFYLKQAALSNAESNISRQLRYELFQNYPNPFNPNTVISYLLPLSSKVTLKVYDVIGNEVATLINAEKSAGHHELTWNASNLPSGLYFYQLCTESFVETKKAILMK